MKHTGDVTLASESAGVSIVALLDDKRLTGRRRLVVTVIGPGHPVQGTVDKTKVALTGVEVGGEENGTTGGVAHGINIESITGEGGGEDLAVDHELRWTTGVLGDLLADAGAVGAVVIPVEVEGDEDLHVVVGGGLVREVELLVGVRVDTDVQSEGVDADGLGALHVAIIVGRAVPVGADTDLTRGNMSASSLEL